MECFPIPSIRRTYLVPNAYTLLSLSFLFPCTGDETCRIEVAHDITSVVCGVLLLLLRRESGRVYKFIQHCYYYYRHQYRSFHTAIIHNPPQPLRSQPKKHASPTNPNAALPRISIPDPLILNVHRRHNPSPLCPLLYPTYPRPCPSQAQPPAAPFAPRPTRPSPAHHRQAPSRKPARAATSGSTRLLCA
jgi:hypothetical protein